MQTERVIDMSEPVRWITVKGVHLPVNADGTIGVGSEEIPVTSEQKSAIVKWAKNNKTIKEASAGTAQVKMPFYTEFNLQQDTERAKHLEDFISGGKGVKETIYRGIDKVSDEEYKRYTTIGETINQKGLSSWTTDKKTGNSYARQYGNNGILFVKQGDRQARSVGNIAGTDNESEVIMSAKSSQIVERVEKKNGVTIVYLK